MDIRKFMVGKLSKFVDIEEDQILDQLRANNMCFGAVTDNYNYLIDMKELFPVLLVNPYNNRAIRIKQSHSAWLGSIFHLILYDAMNIVKKEEKKEKKKIISFLLELLLLLLLLLKGNSYNSLWKQMIDICSIASPYDIVNTWGDFSLLHIQSIKVISVIGPPGIGKNTILKPICDKMGYKHISWGDMLREVMKIYPNDTVSNQNGTISNRLLSVYAATLRSLNIQTNIYNIEKIRENAYIEMDYILGLILKMYLMMYAPNSIIILDNAPRRLESVKDLVETHHINLIGYIELDLNTNKDISILIDRLVKRDRSKGENNLIGAKRRINDIYYGLVKPRLKDIRAFLTMHTPTCQQFDIFVSLSDNPNFNRQISDAMDICLKKKQNNNNNNNNCITSKRSMHKSKHYLKKIK